MVNISKVKEIFTYRYTQSPQDEINVFMYRYTNPRMHGANIPAYHFTKTSDSFQEPQPSPTIIKLEKSPSALMSNNQDNETETTDNHSTNNNNDGIVADSKDDSIESVCDDLSQPGSEIPAKKEETPGTEINVYQDITSMEPIPTTDHLPEEEKPTPDINTGIPSFPEETSPYNEPLSESTNYNVPPNLKILLIFIVILIVVLLLFKRNTYPGLRDTSEENEEGNSRVS